MSFLDYLKEHRGQFIDHRITIPLHQGVTAIEADEQASSEEKPPSRRGKKTRPDLPQIRFRHIRPVFSPSPFSDPLPYEEPWERAFR